MKPVTLTIYYFFRKIRRFYNEQRTNFYYMNGEFNMFIYKILGFILAGIGAIPFIVWMVIGFGYTLYCMEKAQSMMEWFSWVFGIPYEGLTGKHVGIWV